MAYLPPYNPKGDIILIVEKLRELEERLSDVELTLLGMQEEVTKKKKSTVSQKNGKTGEKNCQKTGTVNVLVVVAKQKDHNFIT